MTHPRLRKEESDVKKWLLSGYSATAVSKRTGYSRSRVSKIINRLIHYGEIRRVPGTTNPVIYEEPFPEETFPLKGEESPGSDNMGSVSDLTGPPEAPEAAEEVPSVVQRTDLKLVRMTGISTDKVCPDGYVEAHMTGCINMQVVTVGGFNVIRDPSGCTAGFWTDPKPMRGSVAHGGEVRIFNQTVKWQYREGNKGSKTFQLFPGRIFLDPKQYKSEEEAKDVFIDRATFVASLLARDGWQLRNPQIRGEFEYAIRDHPLVGLMTKGSIPSGSDIVIDTSKGVPEAEMKHIDEWDKVRIWANVPSEILNLDRRVQSQDEHIDLLDARVRATIGHIDAIDGEMDALLRLIERQNAMIAGLVENINQLVQAGSNLLTIQSQMDALRMNDFTRMMSEYVSAQARNGDRNRKDPMEGYN